MPEAKLKIRKLKAKTEYRSFDVEKSSIDSENRTMEISFSSDARIERWFGIEILDHSDGSVRMERINTKAPFLDQHDSSRQIGVIEKAWIDSESRKGRALVRFGKSQLANEIFQDFVDGIRSSISVGYRVLKAILTETGEDGSPDVYRVTEWEPYEISSVSIPADLSVGVGRSETLAENEFIIEERRNNMPLLKNPEEGNVQINEESIRSESVKTERKRIEEINAIAKDFGLEDEARSFIADGKSADLFRSIALDKVKTRNKPLETPKTPGELGLTDAEKREYSFVRLIRAIASKNPKDAEFELELSEAVAKKLGRSAQGAFVPMDILSHRAIDGSTGKGAELISTNLLVGSFIELLRNKMLVKQLGATILSGLVGNVEIPKGTAGANTYWISKNGDAPETNNNLFGQVSLSPKTIGTYSDIMRSMLKQSSMGVEAYVRNMLATDIALGIDLAVFHGTGVDNQPLGIFGTPGVGSVALGDNGAAPTIEKIVELETKIAASNADLNSLAYVTNAKGRGALKTTKVDAGSGIMIWQNSVTPGEGSVNGYRSVATNQIKSDFTKGTGSGLSGVCFGNFADVVIGEWGVLDINVDPSAKALSGGLRVVALQDIDVAIKNAASFAVIKDMIA